MNKYVAYYRVSTKKQGASGLGLTAQKDMVNNYINSSDGILVADCTEIESGKKNDRPQLAKALELCAINGYTLIVAKLDRLSRSVSFISSLTDSNVDFICVDFPSANKFTLHLFASVAQYERELISARTKSALQAKKDAGAKLGAPNATFTTLVREKGLKKRKENAANNANNQRAKAIVLSLVEKMNYNQIAKYLNDNNFRTSRGKLFQAIQVQRLIK